MSSAGFLLDTNVLSELLRDGPAPAVLQWFAGQTAPLLHTSTVTQAEMLAGIAVLPAGKRRDALAQAAQQSTPPWCARSASTQASPSTQKTPRSPPLHWPRA